MARTTRAILADFRQFCRNVTPEQRQNIYAKEKAARRGAFADECAAAMRERGEAPDGRQWRAEKCAS